MSCKITFNNKVYNNTKDFLDAYIKNLSPMEILAFNKRASTMDLIENEEGGIDLQTNPRKLSQYSKSQKEYYQNMAINVYKSVYKSPSDDVQKQINKVLSMEKATKAVEIVSAINNVKNNPFYSPFDNTVQFEQLSSGSDGQLGIGVHSNAVVFHNLCKRAGGVPFGRMYGVGGLNMSNILGQETTTGSRSVSDVNTENQNSATDNIKAGIMSKRNENAFTINALVMMTLKGLDLSPKGAHYILEDSWGNIDVFSTEEEAIEQKKKVEAEGGNVVNYLDEIHIPTLILSQPILREYADLMKKAKSQAAIGQKLDEKGVISVLRKKYADLTNLGPQSEVDFPELTVPNLILGLKGDRGSQIRTLDFFLQMKKESETMGIAQRTINMNSTGLGLSYLDTRTREENLNRILDEDDPLSVFAPLFKIEGKTTPEGETVVESLKLSNLLLSSIFPTESLLANKLDWLREELGISGKQAMNKLKYEYYNGFKQFANQSVIEKLTGLSVEDNINILFKSTVGSKSLARFIQENSGKNGHYIFKTNSFLRNLYGKIDEKTGVDFIYSYGKDNSLSLQQSPETKDFLVALGDNTTVIGVWNGEEITPSKLLRDLTAYALIADQKGGATGFLKDIPVSYLREIGYVESMRDMNDNINDHTTVSVFLNYFLQQPKIADMIANKHTIKEIVDNVIVENNSTLTKVNLAKNFKAQAKHIKEFTAYSAKEIDLPGIFKVTDAEGNQIIFVRKKTGDVRDILSARYIKLKSEENIGIPKYYKNSVQKDSSTRPIQQVSPQLNTTLEGKITYDGILGIVPRAYVPLIRSLRPYLTEKGTNRLPEISIVSAPNGDPNQSGVYLPKSNKIEIASWVINSLNNQETKDRVASVIPEEFIHCAFTNYLHSFGTLNYATKVWEFKDPENLPDQIKSLLEIYEDLKLVSSMKENLSPEVSYYLQNFDEFIAGVFASSEFRETINSWSKIEDATGMTLFDKIVTLIKDVINSITGGTYSDKIQDLVLKSFNLQAVQREEGYISSFAPILEEGTDDYYGVKPIRISTEFVNFLGGGLIFSKKAPNMEKYVMGLKNTLKEIGDLTDLEVNKFVLEETIQNGLQLKVSLINNEVTQKILEKLKENYTIFERLDYRELGNYIKKC